MELGLITFLITFLVLVLFRIFLWNRKRTYKKLLEIINPEENQECVDPRMNLTMGIMPETVKVEDLNEQYEQSIKKIRLFVAITISILVLLAGLYIVLSSEQPEESKKWAFGSIGTIMGYWLKS